jgi:hypothetical protein
MHGNSIDSQKRVERKSGANLLESWTLEERIDTRKTEKRGLAYLQFSARLAAPKVSHP